LLTVRDGKADCIPTDREPDLSLDVSDLGSVYLGGTAPSTLVRAGHIRATAQARPPSLTPSSAPSAPALPALVLTARPPTLRVDRPLTATAAASRACRAL